MPMYENESISKAVSESVNEPVKPVTGSGVTTVYLVRHGTTAWNQALRYQGRADNPLDEAGEKQGACLKDYFKEIPVDLGVTSPLQRARKTLQYCLETQDHPVPVIVDPSVTEMDFGKVDGLTKEEIKAAYPEFYRMYVRNEDRGHAEAPGGESLVQVYERMRDGVLRIVSRHPGETIVIAAPYWDLSFPAMLKQYLEQINVVGITFKYTEEGVPVGLCRARKLFYVTTAGGFYAPEDFGFGYVKALAQNYYGIPDVRKIEADGLDIDGADVDAIMKAAENALSEL